MQVSKKFLIAFLGITAFMQFGLGSWVLFGLNSLLNATHMVYSNDLKVFSTFFGICLFIFASLCVVSIRYNLNNKAEGLLLAKFIGWWMTIGGFIVIAEIHRYDLAAVDFVRGILILIAAYITQRNNSISTDLNHSSSVLTNVPSAGKTGKLLQD